MKELIGGMKIILYYILAFAGGVFLAVQAGFNTQLGSYLKHPVLVVIITSLFSSIYAAIYYISFGSKLPDLVIINRVPWYLWFLGALFSVTGISLYFYTIPKLGISRMITLGLFGQILFSIIAGKLGLMSLPQEPITLQKIIGVITMMIGISLINIK